MSKPKQEITITRAKGRPMLNWVGKQALERATAYPAQAVEQFSVPAEEAGQAEIDWSDWPERYPRGGLLFHGDNKDVLAHLLANGFRGKVKLIYIDPPFDSGADYVRKVQLRGPAGTTKIEGEEYTLGEQIQYTDIWANDNYLQFMFERFLLLKELMADDGFIAIHCDEARNSYLRVLLDEVFGMSSFRNEVIWHYSGWNRFLESRLNNRHDTILVYSKSGAGKFGKVSAPWESKEAYVTARKQKVHLDDNGREYVLSDAGGGKRVERFLDEAIAEGRPIDDVWKLDKLNNSSKESFSYETQKPESLLTRVMNWTSVPGDLVLDCFVGSGTTAAVAQKLGRRWIGCDINKGAIQTTAKRLQAVIREQAEAASTAKQGKLVENEEQPPLPAQFSFSTWRVNDYDLQIQHNEAVELACEHIGITRTRSDSFFDGRLGERLVRIIPFNHPLSPLDLDDIDAELKRRPEEQRDVTVVCLGLELAARHWVERHNRNRPINRYHIIELRTDSKYGGFIKHEPLEARVEIRREGDQLQVEVLDVFSPTIVQRLNMEKGVFRAKIDDWRAVVDCILIDSDYDGELFNVKRSDIPARKTDLVAGQYTLPAPDGATTVAVKIIDMLGEELILTEPLDA